MRTSPIILSVDTSTQKIGVAVYDGLNVICEYIWESKDHHTVELAPAVVEILSRSNLKMSQMGALAVALGPGSFTGLRIGLAFAKGLSFPRRLPIIGISTFDILVSAQKEENLPVIAILQAGRNRLAVGWYKLKSGKSHTADLVEVLTPEQLNERIKKPSLVCGEFNEELIALLKRNRSNVVLASPAHSLRRPSFLAELAWKRWQSGKIDDPSTLSPIYLHFDKSIPE